MQKTRKLSSNASITICLFLSWYAPASSSKRRRALRATDRTHCRLLLRRRSRQAPPSLLRQPAIRLHRPSSHRSAHRRRLPPTPMTHRRHGSGVRAGVPGDIPSISRCACLGASVRRRRKKAGTSAPTSRRVLALRCPARIRGACLFFDLGAVNSTPLTGDTPLSNPSQFVRIRVPSCIVRVELR